ncbi:hypothetical protein ARMGADRAFT_1032078 [Armillaria gallica]|uniref:Uncharacterized protein n=1 Tax=Armillaria gallica TaxID=47427 RepID=A0A2H3D6W5_ARMGA|nr:hypothetical protein ARMGADRAFT_1032078 [Armillaria gallica]
MSSLICSGILLRTQDDTDKNMILRSWSWLPLGVGVRCMVTFWGVELNAGAVIALKFTSIRCRIRQTAGSASIPKGQVLRKFKMSYSTGTGLWWCPQPANNGQRVGSGHSRAHAAISRPNFQLQVAGDSISSMQPMGEEGGECVVGSGGGGNLSNQAGLWSYVQLVRGLPLLDSRGGCMKGEYATAGELWIQMGPSFHFVTHRQMHGVAS